MLLVIFDLNGTLLRYTETSEGISAVPRAHAARLVGFLMDLRARGLAKFAVWSSGQRAKIIRALRMAYPGYFVDAMEFIYDRSKCCKSGTSKHLFLKDLSEISETHSLEMHQILLVDDTLDKVPYSQRKSLFHIRSMTNEDTNDGPNNDTALLELMGYIEDHIEDRER